MEKKNQTIASLHTHSFSVHLDEVVFRDGRSGKRIRLDHPHASAVIPFLSDNRIIMVKQFRYALGRETLEIPAGKLDPGEGPLSCAKRELREETGYEADEITPIITYAPAIGYSNELIHIFSGRNLRKVESTIDEHEIGAVEVIRLEEIQRMVRRGLIMDGKTLLGLSMIGRLV